MMAILTMGVTWSFALFMRFVALWNEGILRTSEKGKNWVTSEA